MLGVTSSRLFAIWSRSALRWSETKSERTCRRALSNRLKSVYSTHSSVREQARLRAKVSAKSCATENSTTRKSRSRYRRAAAASRCSKILGSQGDKWGATKSAAFFEKSGGGRHKHRRGTCQD